MSIFRHRMPFDRIGSQRQGRLHRDNEPFFVFGIDGSRTGFNDLARLVPEFDPGKFRDKLFAEDKANFRRRCGNRSVSLAYRA